MGLNDPGVLLVGIGSGGVSPNLPLGLRGGVGRPGPAPIGMSRFRSTFRRQDLSRGFKAYTLTADSGAYALSGVSSGLNYSNTAERGIYLGTAYAGGVSPNLPLGLRGGVGRPGPAPIGFSRFRSAFRRQDLSRQLSAAAYTMPAGLGSYSLVGSDALGDYAITAGLGSYALTGETAALRRGVLPLAATRGNYALTGEATRLLDLRVPLGAARGSYALTGEAAALRKGFPPVAAATGSYALTGELVTLTKIGSYSITSVQGSYSLTGRTAGLPRLARVSSAGGSYALSGFPTLFLRGARLSCAEGEYALTGHDAAFSAGFVPWVVDHLTTRVRGPGHRIRVHGPGSIEVHP